MKVGLERRRGGPGGAANAQGAQSDGEALSRIEEDEMNGSEFERENIATDALSAASAFKPAEPAREHVGRPPAEGLYDPSLEKDSCGLAFIAHIQATNPHPILAAPPTTPSNPHPP